MSEPISLAHLLTEKQEDEPAGMLLADIDAILDHMASLATAEPFFVISGKKRHVLLHLGAKGNRYARWRQIRKRQRRAAQRRHERGKE